MEDFSKKDADSGRQRYLKIEITRFVRGRLSTICGGEVSRQCSAQSPRRVSRLWYRHWLVWRRTSLEVEAEKKSSSIRRIQGSGQSPEERLLQQLNHVSELKDASSQGSEELESEIFKTILIRTKKVAHYCSLCKI